MRVSARLLALGNAVSLATVASAIFVHVYTNSVELRILY